MSMEAKYEQHINRVTKEPAIYAQPPYYYVAVFGDHVYLRSTKHIYTHAYRFKASAWPYGCYFTGLKSRLATYESAETAPAVSVTKQLYKQLNKERTAPRRFALYSKLLIEPVAMPDKPETKYYVVRVNDDTLQLKQSVRVFTAAYLVKESNAVGAHVTYRVKFTVDAEWMSAAIKQEMSQGWSRIIDFSRVPMTTVPAKVFHQLKQHPTPLAQLAILAEAGVNI